jgi:carbonic anhydrase/acetyltransferase-like protein (isoleucine patch superfamily)
MIHMAAAHTLSITAFVSMRVHPIMLRPYRGVAPTVAASAYVDPSAQVIGDVTIGERSSIWPNTVVRGDNGPVRIGSESNIQDNSVLHLDEGIPLTIGDRVTVGHSVVLHGCTIEDDALIGIGSIVLNKARIGKGAVIAAGALVPEGVEIPPAMVAMGVPARPFRAVTAEEQARFRGGVAHYVEKGQIFRDEQGQKE